MTGHGPPQVVQDRITSLLRSFGGHSKVGQMDGNWRIGIGERTFSVHPDSTIAQIALFDYVYTAQVAEGQERFVEQRLRHRREFCQSLAVRTPNLYSVPIEDGAGFVGECRIDGKDAAGVLKALIQQMEKTAEQLRNIQS